ncbi:Hint domain-containing protein [Rhodobacter ferrooxidans]|uniref:Uncharacterized protein n=1 Tax=Rhodobacter ferrooxidans TaxID=371731 RepID=C8RZS8_9RHOB|nr:Hint domain-containing protein [Rhodobacter sp. SW2]EEW25875.1 hypothetical protein Rsw2DRAFT_1306 [Rhodobacter sp. SW2]
MATMYSGLGGPTGYGENSFIGHSLTSGNYDDGSIAVNITSVFGPSGINYFGTNYTSIYINTNGLISFTGPNTSYTPTNLATQTSPLIAPFWTDIDITGGSATGNNNIYWDLDPTTGRVTITWLRVRGYTGSGTTTNSFQVVLDASQNGNFNIEFIYNRVQFTNGGYGVAQAGYTDGGANDYILPGSGNATALAGYPTAVLDPGSTNGTYGQAFWNGNPVCFVAGTQIATPQGPRAVQDLRAGDLVCTLDDGAQPLRWVGGGNVIATGAACPVRIAAGVLDNDRDLAVSGQHLLLLSGVDCELLFGEAEVLVSAKDLLGLPGVSHDPGPQRVSYHHLLLDAHHVLLAEGTPAESLRPGPMALASLPDSAVAELQAVFLPWELDRLTRLPAARRVLKPHEAQVLLAARLRGGLRAMAAASRQALAA